MQLPANSTPRSSQGNARRVIEDALRALRSDLHQAPLPSGRLDPRLRLDADLGLDSLARVELLERVGRALQVRIPAETLQSLDTLGDLLKVASAAGRTGGPVEVAALPLEVDISPSRLPPGEPIACATLSDMLAWRAERHPNATHVVLLGESGPEPLSYAALLAGAEAFAAGLAQYALSPRPTVALMLPTSLDYLQAFFGVLLAGGTPVPLYPPAHRSQLEEHVRRHAEILANAGAEALITVREAQLVARWLRSRAPGLRHIVAVPELARRARERRPGANPPIQPALAARLSRLPVEPCSAESLALIQYTSGSTGSPKGVMLTHAQLLANIRAMGATIGAAPQDVFVSWLPLYHDMGLIGAWLGSLYHGCLLILMPPTAFLGRPARWLRAIHDYRGTLSASPNFGYELAARRIEDEELEGLDLGSLRITFNGAEAIYPETLERFRRRFAPHGFRAEAMTPVYGLAEAGVGLTFPPIGRGPLVDRVDRDILARTSRAQPISDGAEGFVSFVSCGRPLPGYALRVIDEAGSEVGERTEGNLQFAGPSATNGYFRNADATARMVCGDWRNTGDRAYLAAGELYVTGRAKDIVIRRGRHIYPEEIESAVGELDGVRKGCVAVFGTREAEAGTERLVVVAETRESDALRRSELKRRIGACVTASIGEPADEIVLAGPHAVLKTSSGKLRRAATRAAYEQRTLERAMRKPALQVMRLALGSANLAVRRASRSFAQLLFGLYAWCALAVFAVPTVALTMLARSPASAWRLNHAVARRVIRLLRIPLGVSGEERLDIGKPHVLVANHSSYSDSLFLTALLEAPHRFAVKAELAHAPVIAGYLRKLQALFLERFAPERSAAEVAKLEDALRHGQSVIVFPEGTFTRATGLRAFHLGAFEAAAAADVPVVPVGLRGARSVLRDGQRLPRRAPIEAAFGAPLTARAGESPFAAAVRLRDEARAHILRHCGEPDLTA
ncbi:MAG TPA: AMP-binding protein [Steroidobacteraceae bacterium]|nr:AMP-binding protein [Steroidobacteraceae bacterium]